MISENQCEDTERIALDLLGPTKDWSRYEISSLQLVFEEIPELKEGEAMFVTGVCKVILSSKQEAEMLACYMLEVFGVHSRWENTHEGSYKAFLQGSRTEKGRYAPVSPWFMGWYVASSLVEPSIEKIIRQLAESERTNPKMLYRGESKEYPSVRSTLSRNWNTTDAKALLLIQQEDSNEGSRIAGPNVDIPSNLQHLGGESNCIDFATMPWVALYFACDSNPAEDGVVWGYDTNQQVNGITFRQPNPGNDIAKGRMENQTAMVIEPETGVIESRHLLRVAAIPKELKPTLMDFLKQANISEDTMMPDILNMAHKKERKIPYYVRATLWVGDLKAKKFDKVLQESNQMVNDQEHPPQIGLYYRGLASAFLRNIHQAENDLLKCSQMFEKDKMPGVLQKNLNLIQSASRHRNFSRLNKKIDLEFDVSTWMTNSASFKFLGWY